MYKMCSLANGRRAWSDLSLSFGFG